LGGSLRLVGDEVGKREREGERVRVGGERKGAQTAARKKTLT